MSVLDCKDIYETLLTDDIIESVGFRAIRQVTTGATIPGNFNRFIPISGLSDEKYPGKHEWISKHEWITLKCIKYEEDTYSLFDDYEHTYKIQIQNNVNWTNKPINKELGYPKYIVTLGGLIEEVHKIYKFIEDDGLTIPQEMKLFV